MRPANEASLALRAAVVQHKTTLEEVLSRHGASDARLFGSVARGDATSTSDYDIVVELDPTAGNELLRVAGIGEEFSRILGVRVDVVTPSLLRREVSTEALSDVIPL